MAESLNTSIKKVVLPGVGFLISAISSLPLAQNLSDPTRPPVAYSASSELNAKAIATGPVLQSVFISSQRRLAIISGQTVHIGEKFGDSRVVKISESEVVLRNGSNLQTLKLFPGLEKQLNSTHIRPGRNAAALKAQ